MHLIGLHHKPIFLTKGDDGFLRYAVGKVQHRAALATDKMRVRRDTSVKPLLPVHHTY